MPTHRTLRVQNLAFTTYECHLICTVINRHRLKLCLRNNRTQSIVSWFVMLSLLLKNGFHVMGQKTTRHNTELAERHKETNEVLNGFKPSGEVQIVPLL